MWKTESKSRNQNGIKQKDIKNKKRFITIIFFAAVLIFSLFCFSDSASAEVFQKTYQYETKWGQDESMKGLFDQSTMYFQVGNWKVSDGVIELTLNLSQLLNTEVSYLTVSLNGQPIQTIPLSEAESPIWNISIPFSEDLLHYENTNSVTVEAYLRGQNTDACVDDSSFSSWMNLFGESRVVMNYVPLLPCQNIYQFYEKFISIEALSNRESLIATGSGAKESVLTALAHMMTGFAQMAKGNHELIQSKIIQSEDELKKYSWVIYADTYERLPDYLQSSMTAQQKKYAFSEAVVCLLDVENTKVLLVTGNSEDALQKAGNLLSNQNQIKMLTNTQMKVSSKEDYLSEPVQPEEYLNLTSNGVQIKGNFEQKASFSIEYPANRKMSDSAELSLDYRYSRNLDFQKSLLTVYINGIPIGSRTLSEEGADGSTELFSIPADLKVSGNFTVETVFELYPVEKWCELTAEEIPWAFIADTSMLKWTTVDHTEVFWEYYPFPFIKDGAFSNVTILLPEEWKESDFQTMSKILLTLGRWQKSNHGNLEVRCTFLGEELNDKNIISIGDIYGNLWNSENYAMSAYGGNASLLISPYGDSLHAILKVTGKNGTDMQKTTQWLGKAERLWELSGDVMWTDGKNLSCRYVRHPAQTIQHPVEAKVLVTEEDIPMVIVCSVLLLVLLPAALILIKYGRKKNGE